MWFSRGGNGVGRHLSHREKLDVPTRASLAAMSVVQTIPSVATNSPRRGTSSLQRGQSASTDIDAIGDVRFHPSTENGRLVFWHSLPVPRLPLVLPSWTIPILILLHPSFLLSLNSRRATARTFPVTFSLPSTSLDSSLPLIPRLFVSLLRALLRTLLRSRRFETATGNTRWHDPFSSYEDNLFSINRTQFPKSRFLHCVMNAQIY